MPNSKVILDVLLYLIKKRKTKGEYCKYKCLGENPSHS